MPASSVIEHFECGLNNSIFPSPYVSNYEGKGVSSR